MCDGEGCRQTVRLCTSTCVPLCWFHTVQCILQVYSRSSSDRARASAKLAKALSSGTADGVVKCRVQLPADEDHSNHVVGEVRQFCVFLRSWIWQLRTLLLNTHCRNYVCGAWRQEIERRPCPSPPFPFLPCPSPPFPFLPCPTLLCPPLPFLPSLSLSLRNRSPYAAAQPKSILVHFIFYNVTYGGNILVITQN